MSVRSVLSLLLLFVSPSAALAAVRGETPEPTPEGERIRRETLAEGLSYIAFAGTEHLEIAQGAVEIGARTMRFRNRLGQLFSVRLDIVDIPTTQRIRELIGQGRWLDGETALMSRVRVRPPTSKGPEEGTDEQSLNRGARLPADCKGPSGSTLAACSPASHGQPWRARRRARSRENRGQRASRCRISRYGSSPPDGHRRRARRSSQAWYRRRSRGVSFARRSSPPTRSFHQGLHDLAAERQRAPRRRQHLPQLDAVAGEPGPIMPSAVPRSAWR